MGAIQWQLMYPVFDIHKMCMLFIYYDGESKEGDFRLVIVNIRDEFWDRPTTPANFWDKCSQCISGIDQKLGGTWFGVSKTGKIGSLLNILQSDPDPNAKSRGSLVPDFLQSPLTSQDYLNEVCRDAKKYNKFNLILTEVSSDMKASLDIVSNWTESEHYMQPKSIDPNGIHVFGNCKTSTPWNKINVGKERFADIIRGLRHTNQRDRLIEEILLMVSDETSNVPDPEMFKQGSHLKDKMLEALSAIYVWSSTVRYGSRTHTIFLMDSHGECEYIERTMDPVTDMNKVTWQTTSHTFSLKRASPQNGTV